MCIQPLYVYEMYTLRNSRMLGMCWNLPEWLVDVIREQQLKRTQSGAAAEVDTIGEQQLKRNWGAAVESDTIGEQQLKRNWGAAVESDTIGEQQLKHNWGAAAEVDTTGEQQLKRTQLGSSKPKWMQSGEAD